MVETLETIPLSLSTGANQKEGIRPNPDEGPSIDRLGTLLPGDPLSRRPGRFQRFDVLAGTVTVPAMLWSAERPTGTLLIAFNGAVRRKAAKDPSEVFQRSSWVHDIDSDILFIADPTLRFDNEISIGWGQGGPEGYAIPAMAQTAFSAAESLGVGSAQRVYYGSSAGGFQALQVAARDVGSRALVNNAQIDWTLYARQNVQAICQHTYHGQSPEGVAQAYPDRTSVARAFAEFENIPRTRYLLNTASKNDVARQLPALLAGLQKGPTAAHPRVDVSLYADPAGGHNPLAKSTTITEINTILDAGPGA